MIPDEIAKQLRTRLYAQVGAFFTNTSRGPGRCGICTAPALADLCGGCAGQRTTYGTGLARFSRLIPNCYP